MLDLFRSRTTIAFAVELSLIFTVAMIESHAQAASPYSMNESKAPASEVHKANGKTAIYRLLPVHYSAHQVRVVQNRLASLAQQAPLDLPARYEIATAALPVVRDQGSRGTCAYFATVGALEAYYISQSNGQTRPTLSEECLVDLRNWMFDQKDQYTGADKPDQRPDPNGDLPASIIQTIQTYGVPATAKYADVDCRYKSSSRGADVSLETYTSTFVDRLTHRNASPAYGKGSSFDLNTQPTIDSVKALISRNIPVVVGIVFYDSFASTSSWNYTGGSTGSVAGGHAVILTGYHTRGKSTVFTFKNSWAEDWGNRGYGTLNDRLLLKSWSYDPSFDFIASLHN